MASDGQDKNLSWQVVFFVLAGVGLLYSGGALLFLLLGNKAASDYRMLVSQRPWVNMIFFTLLAPFPLVIWSYVRDRRRGTHAAMPDRMAGLSWMFWCGLMIVAAGLGGSLVSYFSAQPGGTYVVFVGLFGWGAVTMIRGLFR